MKVEGHASDKGHAYRIGNTRYVSQASNMSTSPVSHEDDLCNEVNTGHSKHANCKSPSCYLMKYR